jgi:glycosyltransferase involved in cell wall biosynthesis
MTELTVILRTCDRVQSFSNPRPRDFGNKTDVIKKCAKSLKDSIDNFIENGGVCKFIIIDDHSSDATVNYLKSLKPNSFIHLYESGNGASFGKCVDIAKELHGLVLLIEDDYLLKIECIRSMVDSYTKIKSDLKIEPCLHPTDYPDRYRKLDPSYITLGSDRHYRSIKYTTCTFMYDSSVFREFEKQLKVFCDYGKKPGITENNSINLVYEKYMCFSPIPSLAEHYQYFDTLSPFFKES